MKNLGIAFVAVVLAIAGSAFTRVETAPCSGVYFVQDKINHPEETTISPANLLYTATDINNNNLPDDGIQFTSGATLPTQFDCPNLEIFVCAVAYAPSDVEERAADGKWVPKANATPVCVLRYEP